MRVTATGRIEKLSVPTDWEGVFHSQVFDRSTRYEPEVAEALTEMFGSRNQHAISVGEVATPVMGDVPGASTMTRLNHTLIEQYSMWRERPLLPHYRVLYLDGIHFTVRHDTQTASAIILTAPGVDLEECVS